MNNQSVPQGISQITRSVYDKEIEKINERAKNRLNTYNNKPNNVTTNESLQVFYNGAEQNVYWNSEKYIDSTIRELLSIKMNLMKESIESLGLEFQKTTQYNDNFIRYKNWVLPGMSEGSPSNETVDTAIALLFATTINGDFPIPAVFLSYIKEMIDNELVNEKYITELLSTNGILYNGKMLVQTIVNAGIGNYAAIALAGALYIESGWNVSGCPKQNEFTGIIDHKRYKLNSKGRNWSDASEGLFGLKFWEEKEKIINDPEFTVLKEKYNIPERYSKYNEDLAGGNVDTMYVVQWKRTRFYASGHLSNLGLYEWCTPLKLFLKNSVYWSSVFEKSPEHDKFVVDRNDDYLITCLSASYIFNNGGGNPTFEKAKSKSADNKAKHASLGDDVQDDLATQLVVSIALSMYIRGEAVGTYDELKQIISNM